jgi:large subunit ribosomal protein L30
MESLIRIKLERGVIASTERQKRTVWALGLRYRESSRVLKDTPAVRGMVRSVQHLVSLEKVKGDTPVMDPFQSTPEYDLGAVSERKPEEKVKKRASAPKSPEESAEAGKTKVAAAPKKSAKAPLAGKKSSKVDVKSTKKVVMTKKATPKGASVKKAK